MNIDQNTLNNYLEELIFTIKEEALEAKKRKILAGADNSFETGYLMGFHRVISLIQQQAESFLIPLSEIKMENIDPYKDLI
jgi:hypothetical protein